MGAYGIIARLLTLIVFIVIGLNQGMQPIAGYNFGAQKMDRVARVVQYTIIAATCVTTLGFVVSQLFATTCVSAFAKDAPQLVERAATGLRIAMIMFPFVGMQIVSTAFFQSIGQPGKSIFLSLTRQMIFLIPCLLILPHFFDDPELGVWFSMPIADLVATLLSGLLLYRQIRQFKRSAA